MGKRQPAQKSVQTDLRIGTSGWTYDDWTGKFYPEEIKGPARLEYYVTQFNAVEINATFYRLPTASMITGWNRRMPEDFHVATKGSRRITHLKRLQDCRSELREFIERAAPLRQLRVILWQFPPSFRPDLPLLESFLALLRDEAAAIPHVRHALEFRHASWWDDEVKHLLQRHRVAFVAVSHPRLPDDIISTTDFLYLRFHGLGRQLYRYDYSPEELQPWVQRVVEVIRTSPVRAVYAFFNNDYNAHAVENARIFRELLAQALKEK
ncbi:MAG: DUF72 domain-containing protein [Thermogutta sp.]|uniref:DUF72 domain-containing protein n=1 Tax=Thermogutta sp. TaxID=1962930 RepID=UPI0019B75A25|nr:DUF72 domain-containing protein [Thermogutta sp.]MBC7352845.1 DUF72 domain-containing protein [Thermogutta sp.]